MVKSQESDHKNNKKDEDEKDFMFNRTVTLDSNPCSLISENKIVKTKQTEEDIVNNFSQRRLLKLLNLDKYYILGGILCAILYGLVTPIYAYIFGEFVNIFVKFNNDSEMIWHYSIIYAMCYLALAIGVTITSITQVKS